MGEHDVERIEDNGKLLALIVRDCFAKKGVSFFTADESPIQMGLLVHPRGAEVKPHLHLPGLRSVGLTQEVLHLRRGKVEVDIYNETKELIRTCVLYSGDTILLALGGHGLRVLEESDMLEVKQGPYMADEKVYF